MSRTIKNSRGPGFEYWKSRYHSKGECACPTIKKLTHKRERAKAKKYINDDFIYLLRY